MNTNASMAIKGEGLIFGPVWESLMTSRRAEFFHRSLVAAPGDRLIFWRRRDGVKHEIPTQVFRVDLGPLRKFFVEETD